MKGKLVRLAKRSRWAVIAKHLVFSRVGLRSQISDHAQSASGNAREAADYVEGVFEALMRHARLAPEDLAGARILEVGPGDNLGLALRFAAAGANQVVTLDRFEVPRDPAQEQAIYAEILARLPDSERARGESAFADGRIEARTGIGVEDAARELAPASFDLIVSIAVLEHVHDPDASFAAMDRLLKPGGLMLHQVDLRDHWMFSGGGQHPLTFLTISPRVWHAMTARWGGPNRRLIDYYRGKLGELGYDTRLAVNHTYEQDLLAEIRPRLQPQFRALSDEDLAAAGIFLAAAKPEVATPTS